MLLGTLLVSSSVREEAQSRTPTPRQGLEREDGLITHSNGIMNEYQQQVAQRPRWQSVLLEAGGIGAAVSEESMRRLKYCLQWLQVSVPPAVLIMSAMSESRALP